MRAKLYIYPNRITQRKPHPILWSFDTEALSEIAKNFKNKSVFSVEIKKKTLILKLIEEPTLSMSSLLKRHNRKHHIRD